MNLPTTPMLVTSQSTCSASTTRKIQFSKRHGVLFIATCELLSSLAGMMIYGYAAYVQPAWNHLIPVPRDLCNLKDIVRGVMFIIILIFVLEFFLAIYLFEGARKRNLSRIRFWFASMITYITLVTVAILGMEFGGIRSPTMNIAAFINIFVRFLEIMIVYVYIEHESMKRKRINCSMVNSSTLTISSEISHNPQGDEEVITPPTTPTMFPASSQDDSVVATTTTAESNPASPRWWRR